MEEGKGAGSPALDHPVHVGASQNSHRPRWLRQLYSHRATLVRFAGQRLDLDLESAEELAARILAEVADRDGDACFRNDEHLLNHLKERLVWRWLDDVRRQKKVEPLADEAACVLDFDRPMMHALRQEVVREVFKQLTASRQKAISMLFEEQRSRAEVAKIFQVTEDTVTNWKRSFQDAVIRRARQEGLE